MNDEHLIAAHTHRESSALRSADNEPGQAVSWSTRHHTSLTVAAACLSPIAYVVFVAHYSLNVLKRDDWSVVPLVDAALRGHLTLNALWAQHTDNRMLFPNLVFVGTGDLTRDNMLFLIALSAGSFIASYGLFLILYRAYGDPTPLAVLTIGIVWFSLVDFENALWAFQFAWYLILLCLVAMLYCLDRRWFVAAAALAVIASFSSFQGLALWPVGMIYLVWRGWDKRIVIWLGVAAITAAVYFWNFNSQPPYPLWSHPVLFAEFVFLEMGQIIPLANSYGVHELIGLSLFAAAGYVIVQSVRLRRDPLPVALIAFGLLFDGFIATGRAELGWSAATPARYTMPNLLIAVAVVAYAMTYMKMNWRLVVPVAVTGQLVLATSWGLNQTAALDQYLDTAARLVVNVDKVPLAEQPCYREFGLFVYEYTNPDRDIDLARTDHFSEFSDGEAYRGLPVIPECPSH